MDYTKNYSEAKQQSMASDAVKSDINTMLIVKVVKVNIALQRVDVKPCLTVKVASQTSKIKVYTRSGKLTPVEELEMPTILDVPICYPRAGNFMITLPIKVGDTGMLLVSQQDITQWKEKGGSGVAQQDIELFDINNSVYLPFIASKPDAISDYNANALELRAGDDKLTMAGDGKIVANCDIIAKGKSLYSHTHTTNLNASALASPTTSPATSGGPN